ncbi:electon transport protein SCO1/SCO2, putative [Trypanosoma cruzi]|uniref:Electon transport protein SCO1/SCO2 n=2 Tax=Trypanosoma cruzi TaxID=5693 RepID=V5BA25_TRYCR|nr:electon transport protein SCO1/SCO2, putative [Trypanosoma cruzi]ESS64514.1 electon transport protein SCO1/SCO2 [Trypanosoma cruzi Dm28c]PBJ74773.1 electon transport protein SCO1/SCO2 [Trypanosoma cruzi cruzi]PBJ78960.1 electon transport protein SCO1/SCO2 [Trypanosoma cruzi cruzi]PWU94973.1 putative electon transport protein SCO1/SCO2 [Trypanosoma cruzi]
MFRRRWGMLAASHTTRRVTTTALWCAKRKYGRMWEPTCGTRRRTTVTFSTMWRCRDRVAVCAWVRLASSTSGGSSGNKDIDVVDETKPIHIRVAEEKDSQIFTMQDYIEREEAELNASRSLGQRLSDARDNPVWMLWALFFLSLGVMTVVVSIRVRREQMRFDPKLRAVKAFDSPDGPSIGGPFSLVGVDGRRYTEKDFLGKWLYIYFGFTNCPDVCPEEMAKMSRVVQHLDKKVGRDYWQPLFISLDPRRDTPEKVREYLADFSPRILGLVGTQEEVEAAAREYRVYFAIPDEEGMSEDDYLVDHSIIMYLMDPEGRFCDYTTKEFQWFESYSKLLRRMMDYEREKVRKQRERGGELQPGERAANMKVANIATMLDESAAAVPSREELENARPQQAMTIRR